MSSLRIIINSYLDKYLTEQEVTRNSPEWKAIKKFTRSLPNNVKEEIDSLYSNNNKDELKINIDNSNLFNSENAKPTIEVNLKDGYFRASTIKDSKGELCWFKIPDASTDLSGRRYARWNQIALEIENGITANKISENLRLISDDIYNSVNNATAGTSPVNNGQLLNWADKVYNSNIALENFLGIGENDPALKLKIMEAAALCIYVVDSEKKELMENTTIINELQLRAKIEDWLNGGIGMSFFFLLYLTFSPTFKQALSEYSLLSLSKTN